MRTDGQGLDEGGLGFERGADPRSARPRTTGEILQDILQRSRDLIRSEVRLAKAETREEAARLLKGVSVLAAGVLLAVYALGVFLLAAVYFLGRFLEPWIAALIVFGVVALIAAIVAWVGLKKVKAVKPMPERTIRTTKEGAEWARSHML